MKAESWKALRKVRQKSTEQASLESDEKQDNEDSVPGELPESGATESKAINNDDREER